MQHVDQTELVAWLNVLPSRLSCLVEAAPAPPREVLRALLERGWVAHARDGRLVRTDKGQEIVEHE